MSFIISIDSNSIFDNLAVSLSPGTDVNGDAYVGFGSRRAVLRKSRSAELNLQPDSGAKLGHSTRPWLCFVPCQTENVSSAPRQSGLVRARVWSLRAAGRKKTWKPNEPTKTDGKDSGS